ncbi:MAG: HAMP domain-containing histidine kinase [Actinobacteria bacterium]|nr:HAMP domain-containing histidine kinase [Actinomycetota bacterium]
MPSDAPGSPVSIAKQLETKARGLSLATRIALTTTAAAVVAVLVAGLVAWPLAQATAEQDSLDSLQRLADTTAAAVERSPDVGSDLIENRLGETFRSQQITAVYAPRGTQIPGLLGRRDVIDLANGSSVDGVRNVCGEQVLMAAQGLDSGGAVVLVQPITATNQIALASAARFGIALAVGVAIAILFGLLLSRRLTRPLRTAANAAKRLGAGDRDVELAVTGPREIAELNEALNELRYALAQSEGRQRDFLLSISHELRTPLTTIMGYSEAISDGIVPDVDVASTGATMTAEAQRLNLLVSDLLDLARLDSVDFRISGVATDFAAIAGAAARIWQDRCAAVGLSFYSEVPVSPLEGRTDPLRVRQIIDNLCTNALRVTPSGGSVTLAVRPAADDDSAVEIEVRDSGPGLTPDDCAVAFEPAELYNRYRGIRKVGSGVGLALVGRLSGRLGGAAQAGSAPEGGARFTVRLSREVVDSRDSVPA